MFTRKIGKIVFGSATPAQLMIGSVLAAMLGFIPGFSQAPGLIALLTVLLVVLNAPLPLAAFVGVLAKLLSLALLPVSFAVGRVLLDGPTQPLFEMMINAPVLALFGFDYYAVTGGMAIGLVVGVAAGVGVIRGVTVIRRKLAGLEVGSEKYQRWMSKKWVRLLLFVVAGGVPKGGFKSLLEPRGKKLLRPLGLVIVAGLVVVGFLLQMLLAEPIVTSTVRTALERANGATVDLERVDLELRNGRVRLHNLAMADPNALETDLFRAAELEADISAADLLRKRITLDSVIVSDAAQGAERQIPGRLVGERRSPREVETREGEKTLEDYLAEAEEWKQRLQQVQDWLERISGPEDEPVDPEDPEVDPEDEPTWQERLEQRVAERGYANVRAHHLVTGRPTLTVLDLKANGVRTAALEDERVDIHAQHLSTHPRLHDQPPRVNVSSSADSLRFDVHMAALAATAEEDDQSTIDFALRNLAVDRAVGQLAGDRRPLSGGTIDLALNGPFATMGGVMLDLPLQVTVRDSTVRGPGGQTAPIERLNLPLGLRGPLANPRITLDDDRLADALADAGASAVAGRVREEAGRALDRATGDLRNRLGFGGGSDSSDGQDESDDEEDEEDNSESRSLEDAAGDALRGLLPGSD